MGGVYYRRMNIMKIANWLGQENNREVNRIQDLKDLVGDAMQHNIILNIMTLTEQFLSSNLSSFCLF